MIDLNTEQSFLIGKNTIINIHSGGFFLLIHYRQGTVDERSTKGKVTI